MRYPMEAIAERAGGYSLVFPTCPGCQTLCEELVDARRIGAHALELWLEGDLSAADVPPRPPRAWSRKLPRNRTLLWVEVPGRLAVRLQLRWARGEAGLTQAALAERAGVSQPAIAQIENPDANPTVATLQKVADALGLSLEIELVRRADAPRAARVAPRAARAGRPRVRRTG